MINFVSTMVIGIFLMAMGLSASTANASAAAAAAPGVVLAADDAHVAGVVSHRHSHSHSHSHKNTNNNDHREHHNVQVRVGATTTTSVKNGRQNVRILPQQEQRREQQQEEGNVGENQQEQQQAMSVTFSLWHPDMNLFLSPEEEEEGQEEAFQTLLGTIQGPVLKALQEFFCEDTGLVVIDENFQDVCDSSGTRNRNRNRNRILQLSLSQDPENSYIVNIPTNLLVSPFSTVNEDESMADNGGEEGEQDEVDVVYWWTWNVNYRLEQIGTQVIEQAEVMNVTDHRQYLQDVTQLALDVSIMEGFMDERLSGTSVYMGMVGLETEMFQDAAERYANGLGYSDDSSEGDDDEDGGGSSSGYTEADLGTNGLILRYIGVALLAVDFVVVTALTVLARRRRRHIEETRGRKSHDAPRLVTEKTVNQMLETGRRESEKYVAQSSQPRPQ